MKVLGLMSQDCSEKKTVVFVSICLGFFGIFCHFYSNNLVVFIQRLEKHLYVYMHTLTWWAGAQSGQSCTCLDTPHVFLQRQE